jgi:Cu/Ag efflux protein CusF
MRTLGIIVLSAALAGPAWAQTKDHSGHGTQQKDAATHKGTAVVKSIDAEKGTVMLAHDPIPSLKWPSMTMKFIARDKKLLSSLKPGQKVQFEFVQQDRDYILTKVK